MARSTDLLADMRRDARGNWTMREIETVCGSHGVECEPPRSGGSHDKVSHSGMREIFTVSFKRPIRPVYIRKLVAFIDALEQSRGAP